MTTPQTAAPARGPLIYGTTIPLSARIFFAGQVNMMADERGPLYLIYGTDEPGPVPGVDPRVTQIAVPLLRDPHPLRDVASLARLVRLFRRLKPSQVVVGTPKMGLLGMLAAWLLRVPRRTYVLFGLRLEGAQGHGRRLLWAMEWLAMRCSTEILAISGSNRDEVLRLRLTDPDKISVPGRGGLGGIDLDRFHPRDPEARAAARARFDLPVEVPVVGFVGRMTRDKGLGDMALVWPRVREEFPQARLLMVGPDESASLAERQLVETIRSSPGVVMHGPISDPESAFAAMDVLLLLTRREGFGQVLVEAAACGVPCVAARVNGTVDAVVDGSTGTLVPLGDIDAAVEALAGYLRSEALRSGHGTAAQERAVAEFAAAHLDRLWVEAVDPTLAREVGS